MNTVFAWLKRWMPILVGVATVASLVAIPLWLQSRDTRRQYVQVAIDILRDADVEKIRERQELRVWAVKIVNNYAPVKLSEEAKAVLIEKGWQSVGWDAASFDRSSFDSDAFAIGSSQTMRKLTAEECRAVYSRSDDRTSLESCLAVASQ